MSPALRRCGGLLLLGATLSAWLVSSGAMCAADWLQWRGPDRTDRSPETGLLKSWPAGGPAKAWVFKNAGLGYSGYSIAQGRLFTMGARDNKEMLIALDVKTGTEIWATPLGDVYPNNWGDGPRGTPTVDGARVFALAAQGGLFCVEAATGKQVWSVKLQDFGGKLPGWGYCESPLVEGDSVYCTPGGAKGAMVALDKATGKLKWQSAEFVDEAHYSSIVPATIHGVRQLVQLTPKTLAGVSLADGKVLWKTPWTGRVAVIPTPVIKDDVVYITSGYGVGSKAVRIGKDNQPTDLYENKVMKNHHGGVVLVGDHLYGYSDGPGWICQDLLTGKEVWASKTLGKGAVTYADGMLYCLDEGSGDVALVEASPAGWKEISRFKLDPQTTLRKRDGRIWTHPVISHGKLFLRDQELLFCFDVKGS